MEMEEKDKHNVTLRAIIIGLILVPVCIYWVMMTEVKWYVLQGTSIPYKSGLLKQVWFSSCEKSLK
jgi:hypothetical protein